MRIRRIFSSYVFFITIAIFNTSVFAEEVPLVLDGVELETVIVESGNETAEMVIDNFILPNEDILRWPYILSGDLQTTVVSASFNGTPLTIINSESLSTDYIESLVIDISAFQGQSGELSIKLESTGTTSANLFLIKYASSPSLVPIITYILY